MASKLEINNQLREGLRSCRCGMKASKRKNGGVYLIFLGSAEQAASKATKREVEIQRASACTFHAFHTFFSQNENRLLTLNSFVEE